VGRALTGVAIAAIVLSAAGCGSSGDDNGGGSGGTTATARSFQQEEERAEAEAPPGASPVLQEIYRQFPPPQPDPSVKQSAAVISAGERACRGKTPLEVKEEFIDESDLLPSQAERVAELAELEASTPPNGSFVTGQLGALVYERTLPERVAHFGYEGCVYSLSLVVKRQLAPG
jgi:hypothetical protein